MIRYVFGDDEEEEEQDEPEEESPEEEYAEPEEEPEDDEEETDEDDGTYVAEDDSAEDDSAETGQDDEELEVEELDLDDEVYASAEDFPNASAEDFADDNGDWSDEDYADTAQKIFGDNEYFGDTAEQQLADAGFAPLRDGDAQRHELLRPDVQRPVFLHRLRQHAEALGRCGDCPVQNSQLLAHVLVLGFPVHGAVSPAASDAVLKGHPQPAGLDISQFSHVTRRRARADSQTAKRIVALRTGITCQAPPGPEHCFLNDGQLPAILPGCSRQPGVVQLMPRLCHRLPRLGQHSDIRKEESLNYAGNKAQPAPHHTTPHHTLAPHTHRRGAHK